MSTDSTLESQENSVVVAPLPDFLETIRRYPLVFDGATGTLLYERGVYLNKSFDEVCLNNPDLVRDVHRDYIDVGVDVIQTNTFGSNRIALAAHGLADSVDEICTAAVRLAKEAARGRAWVAGSIGPTTLLPKDLIRSSTRTKAFEAFHEQITALTNAGADLLLFETFHYLGELETAVEAAYHVNIPIVSQVTLHDDGHGKYATLDGAYPREVVERLKSLGVSVVGVNCVLGPNQTLEAIEEMLDDDDTIVLMQPNAGAPQKVDGRAIYQSSPETFGVVARRAFKRGVRAVGGCCGTTPEHMRRVVGAARMMGGGRWRTELLAPSPTSSSVRTPVHASVSEALAPVPLAERSAFAAKLARGEFVVSVEMNPPVGLDPAATLNRIRSLEGLADVVNIPDGPRATVRMSNLALARLVLETTSVEPLLHVCARDRNLLALQGDLLGAHALGIRNLVIITGDPPKLGDYPDASAVFDVDSVGLLGIAHGFNCGIDPAHKQLPKLPGGARAQTRFVLATGVEPAALDFDREMGRLRDKVEAGANLVMTQPVFSADAIERFLDAVQPLNCPVLVGILPLASSRNANFMHQNVPGMQVPAAVRAALEAAGDDPAAQQRVGVEIAAKALEAIKHRVAGVYIMPPFGRVEMAADILRQAGIRPAA